MPDRPYLNRELDEKFSDIKDSLGRIERQTTKTNGRVNKLERLVLALFALFIGSSLSNPELLKLFISFL